MSPPAHVWRAFPRRLSRKLNRKPSPKPAICWARPGGSKSEAGLAAITRSGIGQFLASLERSCRLFVDSVFARRRAHNGQPAKADFGNTGSDGQAVWKRLRPDAGL